MALITTHIRWVMLIAGVLTCTMALAAVDPSSAMLSMFGESIESTGEGIIFRNWAILITLMGAMLIYAAYVAKARGLVLTVVGTSKLAFVLLMLLFGRSFLSGQMGIAVAIDLVWVVIFGLYLLSTRTIKAVPQQN
jgi:hypothetical protein